MRTGPSPVHVIVVATDCLDDVHNSSGAFVAHLIAALLGTRMVESSIWAVLGRPPSLAGVEAKIWFMSRTIAALLGLLISRYRPSKSALWVLALPGAILAFRVLLYGLGKPAYLAEHFLAPIAWATRPSAKTFWYSQYPLFEHSPLAGSMDIDAVPEALHKGRPSQEPE